jgi:hypothetical protein
MSHCKHWIRTLLLGLLMPVCCLGQEHYYSYFNTDDFWKHVVLENPDAVIRMHEYDTAIVVASNRKQVKDALRFMSEFRGNGAVQFFLVYVKDTIWHVHPMTSLRAAVEALPRPDKDWVVYTEGMGKIFTTDLDRGLSMAHQYDVNVLLLDYPSICSKYKAYRNYRFAMRHSRAAYKDFAPVLDSFKKLRNEGMAGTGKLSLFFHSMGNNVIRGIARSGRYLKHYNDTVWADNLILNAPCVPYRKSAQWIDSIHFARHVFIHYNPNDQTLKWARIIGFRRILGERPRAALARNATYINFSPVCSGGHSNFLNLHGRPPALKMCVTHYNALLHGGTIQDTLMYRKSAYRNIGYELFQKDKGPD